MYKKILVPLDGSRLSAGVMPYVCWLARGLNLSLELLHVNDPARLAPYAPPLQGSDYLQGVAAGLSGIVDVQCTVELGDPAEVILDRASAEPETLVAIATHGHSGPKRWLLGSVAEKVLRASHRALPAATFFMKRFCHTSPGATISTAYRRWAMRWVILAAGCF